MSSPSRSPSSPPASPRPADVVRLPLVTDAALVAALRAGRPEAPTALFDRYGSWVRRVLLRILGPDPELADLLHDVFVAAYESIDRLEDPARLRQWLTSIAVFSARARIRRRQRSRLLVFPWADAEAEAVTGPADAEMGEAVRCVYAVLDRLPERDRTCFVLRFLMKMEIGEIAGLLEVSHATAKRRVAAARKRFDGLAARQAALRPWLEEGGEP